MKDKDIQSLIKKVQKKCDALRKKKKKNQQEVEFDEDTSSEIFSEMKKRPFSE